MADPEIRAIWEQHNASHLYEMAPEFTVRNTADGWEVAVRDGRSVHPTTSYATREGAAARLLQMLGIVDPIRPQDWPESVEIQLPDSPQ